MGRKKKSARKELPVEDNALMLPNLREQLRSLVPGLSNPRLDQFLNLCELRIDEAHKLALQSMVRLHGTV